MAFDWSEITKGIGEMKARADAAARPAVDRFGEHVIGDAQQITPVDEGTLQASGTTEPASIDGDTITKTIGFNTDYAAAVHEDLTAHHKAPGQAKFLSTALKADAPKFGPFVAGEVKAALG